MQAAKGTLYQNVEATRAQDVDRPTRLSKTARLEIIDLIDQTPLSRLSACAVAGVARSSYYRWRKRANNTSMLSDKPSKSPYIKLAEREYIREAFFKAFHSPPLDHGFNRTTWKVDDLQQALRIKGLALGRHTIRSIIRNAGYRWRKAKTVLTSRDADYRTKLDHVQKILASLAEDEGFFSIDEFGPFAVKHRAGRLLVPPGENPTVPQWQKSKGFIIITAALESRTNQITHFYS